MAPSHSGDRLHALERGAARLGVLIFILVVTVVTYVAVTGGGVYLDHRKFRDQMVVHGRLAQTMDDEMILRGLYRSADRLELPADAKNNIRIRRSVSLREIHIESGYEKIIELPFYRWAVRLHPNVTVSF